MSLAKRRARKAFSDAVLARDGYLCVICQFPDDLAVHHITNRRKMPNGGYVPQNGVSLCPSCHILAESGTIRDEYLYELIGSSHSEAFVASVRLVL